MLQSCIDKGKSHLDCMTCENESTCLFAGLPEIEILWVPQDENNNEKGVNE